MLYYKLIVDKKMNDGVIFYHNIQRMSNIFVFENEEKTIIIVGIEDDEAPNLEEYVNCFQDKVKMFYLVPTNPRDY